MRVLRVMLRRSVRENLQILVFVVATPLVVPIFLLLVFPHVFEALVRLPEFGPDRSYVQYIAPATVLMCVMLGSLSAGVNVAFERATGYYDRMWLSPSGPAWSNLARRLSDAVRVAAFAVLLTAIAWLAGAPVESWPLVLVLSVGLAFLWSLAYGGLPFAVCLRTGRPEAAQAVLPLFFPVLFMSDAFVPRSLLPHWLQVVSDWNPATYIAGAIRSAYVGAPDGGLVWRALLAIAIVMALTQLLVLHAERGLAAR